jgi:hypothetical protein
MVFLLRSKILLLAFVGLFVVRVFGQGAPEPILIDEHGEIPCDDTLSRIDIFFSELSRFPDSSGLVVLSAPLEDKARLIFRQTIIEYQTKWRSFDSSRFQIIRARANEGLTVQFWRIPPGSDAPLIADVDMSFAVPKTIRPFMMGYETKMGDQICPEVDDGEIFARFLGENRTARGHIVIRDNSFARARRSAARAKRKFESKYGISGSRLRTFTGKLMWPASHDEPIVEYWYLP